MKTISVELPEDLVAEVQQILQKRLAAARHEADLMESQLKKLSGKPIPVARVKHDTAPLPGIGAASGRRFTKAEVEKTLVTFLRGLNGNGIGITELYDKIGASYSTTFRALRNLRDQGVVDNVDSKWKILK